MAAFNLIPVVMATRPPSWTFSARVTPSVTDYPNCAPFTSPKVSFSPIFPPAFCLKIKVNEITTEQGLSIFFLCLPVYPKINPGHKFSVTFDCSVWCLISNQYDLQHCRIESCGFSTVHPMKFPRNCWTTENFFRPVALASPVHPLFPPPTTNLWMKRARESYYRHVSC